MSLEDIEQALLKNLSVKDFPETFDLIWKPFGKGLLTTDGVQYSTEVGSIDTTYTAIETVEIKLPSGYNLYELEFGLTVAVKSSAAVESVLWKFQARDPDTTWEDLIAAQTRAASCAAYFDMSASGRWKPTGRLKATGTSIFIQAVIASGAAAGETATGKMKNSSYIIGKFLRK